MIGGENALGEPVPVRRALDRVFGLVLLNDWSARDVQAWEYQPLGPFLAKNFATTIGAWVVPLEALAPGECPRPDVPRATRRCSRTCSTSRTRRTGAIDLDLEVRLVDRPDARTRAARPSA